MPPAPSDWNAKVIEEFRASRGRLGGDADRAPVVLLHHQGRNSGAQYVNPLAYLADEDDSATIYLFASKAGAPVNPDWYHNLKAAGRATVEIGEEKYDVTVRELTGADRDRVYGEQARRYQGFAGYAAKAAGVRVIPVLALTRVSR